MVLLFDEFLVIYAKIHTEYVFNNTFNNFCADFCAVWTGILNIMKKLPVILGPTATGKTALAIKLSKKYNGELISADSRQVYKNLDIGSGKIALDSKIEKHDGFWIVDGVRVNGFDLVEPEEKFTAA